MGFPNFKVMWNDLSGILLPEMLLIGYICYFVIFLLLMRTYFRRLGKPELEITADMNFTTWVLMYFGLLTYWILIFSGPICYESLYGIYCDPIIFSFRAVFVALFIFYYIYILYENTNGVYFNFEYLIILVVAMLGLSLMALAHNFLNLFLFMELYAICIYYLIHNKRTSESNSEAAFKYFVISSFSTAFFLFGVFFVYLAHGSIEYSALNILRIGSKMEFFGYFLIVFGLLLKIGGGVFFFWVLDSYEGSSYPILMFLNIFVKPVFIFVTFKIITFGGTTELLEIYKNLLFITSLIGVLGAAMHTKIKRFLIFTSLYNVGFLSCFFWDPISHMLGGFVVFFGIYGVNAFGIMLLFSLMRVVDNGRKVFCIDDIKDLSSILPQDFPAAAAIVGFLLSSSGLPPFSVFFVKYFLFVKLFTAFTLPYLLMLMLASAISLFYYVRIIRIILSPTRPTFFFSLDSPVVAYLLSGITCINIYFVLEADTLLYKLNLFILHWA